MSITVDKILGDVLDHDHVSSDVTDLSTVATSGSHLDLSNIGTNTHAQLDTFSFMETQDIHLSGLLNKVGKSDTVKNINLSQAYAYLKEVAQAEGAEENIAFFSDAVDI